MKPKINFVQIVGMGSFSNVIDVQFLDKYSMIHFDDGSFVKTNADVTVFYEKAAD